MRRLFWQVHLDRRVGWLAAAVCLIIAGTGLWRIQDRNADALYQSQLRACARGNLLRREVSNRTIPLKETTALVVRLAQASGDTAMLTLAARLQHDASMFLHAIDPIDCQRNVRR